MEENAIDLFKHEYVLRRSWKNGFYEIRLLHYHKSQVTGVVLTDLYLITSSKDGRVFAWEYLSGSDPVLLCKHDGEATCVDFDGESIYSGGTDGLIRGFSLFNSQELLYVGHEDSVSDVKASTSHLVSASEDR